MLFKLAHLSRARTLRTYEYTDFKLTVELPSRRHWNLHYGWKIIYIKYEHLAQYITQSIVAQRSPKLYDALVTFDARAPGQRDT